MKVSASVPCVIYRVKDLPFVIYRKSSRTHQMSDDTEVSKLNCCRDI
jgi:hypothetical protein